MSRTGSSLLPRFDAPPVEEVRIGVVFAPLPISVTELPALFETYSDRYPETRAAQARRVPESSPVHRLWISGRIYG